MSANTNWETGIATWSTIFQRRRREQWERPAYGLEYTVKRRHGGVSTRAHLAAPLSTPDSFGTPESPFTQFRNLNTLLSAGVFPSFSTTTLGLARAALDALDSRADENVDEWAKRIAGDLGVKND
jgi:hypothetical protein